MTPQISIKEPVKFSGVGVHSAKETIVEIHPNEPDTGIIFHVMDSEACVAKIPATINHVLKKQLRTVINLGHYSLDTVEHLLAAIYGLGIDNLIIKVWGIEIPISDGSANQWSNLLLNAELVKQQKNKRYFNVLDTIIVQSDDAWCSIEPWDNYRICYTLEYDHPAIGQQHICKDIDQQTFLSSLAPARTFGFFEDFEKLKTIGLVGGANLANTVVFTHNDVMPGCKLLWTDEPARHKVLDVIGDLALVGYPIIGKFTGYRSGHNLNQQLVSELMKNPAAWEIVENR